jgi:predicted nucleic acid-binding protein
LHHYPNTIIYYFKGQGKVAEYLSKIPLSELAVPSIVWFELKVGIAKSNSPDKRLAQFNALMAPLRMLPFTDKGSGYFSNGTGEVRTVRHADRDA